MHVAYRRHCLVALPDKKSAFNSHMQAKRLLPEHEMNLCKFVAMSLLRNKEQQ